MGVKKKSKTGEQNCVFFIVNIYTVHVHFCLDGGCLQKEGVPTLDPLQESKDPLLKKYFFLLFFKRSTAHTK